MTEKQTGCPLAYRILEELTLKNRNFCSTDYDYSLEFLQQYLPFQLHEYRDTPYKGWEIPPKWDLIQATIVKDGQILLDAKHPLEVISLSKSFTGSVSLEELKKHLFFDQRYPQRIPYHFRQLYRPWERDWGFCVTKEFYDALSEGNYEIEIKTKESPGYLKIAEYVKKGKHPEGFAFVAHLDHAGMANDDLAGVAVGVELLQKLSMHETKYTYRLILVQEIIGSVYFLDHTLADTPILGSCFLEMLGSNSQLALQESRSGTNYLEQILEKQLQENGASYRKGPFRSIICNDEAVWESHNIPMASLSRYPYPEYHTNADNLSIISREALSEAIHVLYTTALQLDRAVLIEKRFEGVYCLSNPEYQLYVDPGQPAFDKCVPEDILKLRRLMDEMSLLGKYTFVEELAGRVGLPFDKTMSYLMQWEKKGLIAII